MACAGPVATDAEPPTVSVDVPMDPVSESVGHKLPGGVHTRIKKIHDEFVTAVRALGKAKERGRKHQSWVDSLLDGRLPQGSKPYVQKYECEELDMPVNSHTFNVEFPQGATLREARQHLYLRVMRMHAEWDLEVSKMQVARFSRGADYGTFVDRCTGPVDEHAKAVEELGIPGIPRALLEGDRMLSKKAADKLFADTINKLAKERLDEARARGEVERKQREITAAVAKSDPTVLFKNSVQAVVKEMGVVTGKPKPQRKGFAQVDHVALHMDPDKDQEAVSKHIKFQTVTDRLKNVTSPSARGRGRARGGDRGGRKGRGRGSGSDTPSNMSSPPSKPKGDASKGKGKGKGRGRNGGGKGGRRGGRS